ncbi:disulfide oxidoreductase [Falsibacillus albus]|uniref:Disulfide bond formation protein B n=1 Tax=Falsibacillus albus TaxID=2478915 RepID=A0A3L7JWZ0_9BACI|nr:disulfide oxidoreductase [Falsibacillus albus]RLQ94845.1 disulfide bond formation protein B [Falsibacillus albus]
MKNKVNILFVIWVISFFATAGSLFFSEVAGYIPCELCWYQRILMYPMAILGIVAIIRKQSFFTHYAFTLSIIGSLISLFHYGLQKGVFPHSGTMCNQVSCAGQYINWFGFITIPFLALTSFLVISIISFINIRRGIQ